MAKHLHVIGNHDRAMRHDFIRRIDNNVTFDGFDRCPSLESQQVDHSNAIEAIKKLFVVKPRQSGLTTIAELTAQALSDPAHTMVLWEPEEDESADEKSDREALTGFLSDKGASVFHSRDDVIKSHNDSQSTETVAGVGA